MLQIYQLLAKAKTINQQDHVNKEILVYLVKQDLAWLYRNLNTTQYDEQFAQKYLELVQQYANGVPLGYLVGHVFFRGQKIFVDQNVLIPRPATELLVEKTLVYAEKLFGPQKLNVLDLGTGSGCIATSLATAQPNWKFTASDVSIKALQVAQSNLALHDIKNVQLVASDLFANLPNQQFDILISNPPYIDRTSNTYEEKNLQHEPALALFAEQHGLYFYQQILATMKHYLKQDFLVAFEIGFDQKEVLTKILAKDFSQNSYWFEKDYQGHWRFLFISNCTL